MTSTIRTPRIYPMNPLPSPVRSFKDRIAGRGLRQPGSSDRDGGIVAHAYEQPNVYDHKPLDVVEARKWYGYAASARKGCELFTNYSSSAGQERLVLRGFGLKLGVIYHHFLPGFAPRLF